MSRYDDVGGTAGPASPRRPRGGSRRHLRQRIAAWVSIGVTSILVVAALGAYVEYRDVVDSIHHVTISGLGKRPPKYNNALNVLVIGSDSRKGANRRFGASLADGPQRSAASSRSTRHSPTAGPAASGRPSSIRPASASTTSSS